MNRDCIRFGYRRRRIDFEEGEYCKEWERREKGYGEKRKYKKK